MNRVAEYIPGNRWIDCDVCGQTWRFADMRRPGPREAHAGLIVCPDDDSGLHPRDIRVEHRPEGRLRRVE